MTDDTTEKNGVTQAPDDGKTSDPSSNSDVPTRSERERAEFSLRKNAERLRELGGNPADLLGLREQITIDPSEPDDAPLTVGKFREIQKQDARKTAEQMAESIQDENDRQLVLGELKYIVPSGNAEADFKRAQASAFAERNARIAEESQRRTSPRTTAPGSSSDFQRDTEEFVPTPEEAEFMTKFGLSKEKIIAARKKV